MFRADPVRKARVVLDVPIPERSQHVLLLKGVRCEGELEMTVPDDVRGVILSGLLLTGSVSEFKITRMGNVREHDPVGVTSGSVEVDIGTKGRLHDVVTNTTLIRRQARLHYEGNSSGANGEPGRIQIDFRPGDFFHDAIITIGEAAKADAWGHPVIIYNPVGIGNWTREICPQVIVRAPIAHLKNAAIWARMARVRERACVFLIRQRGHHIEVFIGRKVGRRSRRSRWVKHEIGGFFISIILGTILGIAGCLAYARRKLAALRGVYDDGVGYVICASSTDFSSQGDHINVIQTLLMLRQMGVPRDNVMASLPREDGHTVLDPRPHAGLPPLEIPPDWMTCVDTNPIGLRSRISDALVRFSDRPDIRRLVFIFTNHGEADKLCFPRVANQAQFLSDIDLADLFKQLHKPILVVLDACHSSTFAARVIARLSPDKEVGFLTTGPEKTISTVIVLSDDDNVVNRPGGDRAGCMPWFSIFSSSFMRDFLPHVAYTDSNPDLVSFASELNNTPQGSKGFRAEFACRHPDFLIYKLRDFFPCSFSPTDTVRGMNRLFRDVLPLRPSGEALIDDLINMPPATPSTPPAFAFSRVWIERGVGGFEAGKYMYGHLDNAPGKPILGWDSYDDQRSAPLRGLRNAKCPDSVRTTHLKNLVKARKGLERGIRLVIIDHRGGVTGPAAC
jgi:hypothetical protein